MVVPRPSSGAAAAAQPAGQPRPDAPGRGAGRRRGPGPQQGGERRGRHEQRADRGHGKALALLHEHQRHGPRDRRGGAAADERGHREREQRHGQGDLMEVELVHLLQAPGEPVGERDQPPGAPRGERERGGGDREHRHAGEQGLEEQQRRGRGEEPEERRDHADRDLEVIALKVEPRGEHVDDGGVQLGQLLDELGIDAQVVGGRRELEQLIERDDEVRAERRRGDRPDDRVPPGAPPRRCQAPQPTPKRGQRARTASRENAVGFVVGPVGRHRPHAALP